MPEFHGSLGEVGVLKYVYIHISIEDQLSTNYSKDNQNDLEYDIGWESERVESMASCFKPNLTSPNGF